jgi:hypothetical protein
VVELESAEKGKGRERMDFDEVKVFSATKARDRGMLGERITEYLREYKGEVVDVVVKQSSDNEFHCLSFVLFLKAA